MHIHRLVIRRQAHVDHQELVAIVMFVIGIVITAAASMRELLA